MNRVRVVETVRRLVHRFTSSERSVDSAERLTNQVIDGIENLCGAGRHAAAAGGRLLGKIRDRLGVVTRNGEFTNCAVQRAKRTRVALHFLDRRVHTQLSIGYVEGKIEPGTDVRVRSGGREFLVRVHGIVVDSQSSPKIILRCRRASRVRLSLILPIGELLFRVLRCLCVGHWLRSFAVRRGRQWAALVVDWYILLWIGLVTLLLLRVDRLSTMTAKTVVWGVAGYRIFELLVVYYNILLFDRTRHLEKGELYMVVSSARSVFISMISYCELILCYGLIYALLGGAYFSPEGGFSGYSDGLYFSMVTITTLGYGDLQPLSAARPIAGSEAVLGVIFGITIVARMISWLPPVREGHAQR